MILRRDHLQAVALALEFLTDQLGNLGIEIDETLVQDAHCGTPFVRAYLAAYCVAVGGVGVVRPNHRPPSSTRVRASNYEYQIGGN